MACANRNCNLLILGKENNLLNSLFKSSKKNIEDGILPLSLTSAFGRRALNLQIGHTFYFLVPSAFAKAMAERRQRLCRRHADKVCLVP